MRSVLRKSKQRKPMPKLSRTMPSRLDKERQRRFNAYLKLWMKMQDKEGEASCQG